MKKWTKTALLTGCACCIAGAVLMFSGWASGGKAYAETYDLNAMSGSAKKEDGISTVVMHMGYTVDNRVSHVDVR